MTGSGLRAGTARAFHNMNSLEAWEWRKLHAEVNILRAIRRDALIDKYRAKSLWRLRHAYDPRYDLKYLTIAKRRAVR